MAASMATLKSYFTHKLQMGFASILLVAVGVVIGWLFAPSLTAPPPPPSSASSKTRQREGKGEQDGGKHHSELFPAPPDETVGVEREHLQQPPLPPPPCKGLIQLAPTPALDSGYKSCITTGKATLFAILGLTDGAESDAYAALPWLLQPSGATSYIWSCRSEDRGILLRTSVVVKSTAPVVLRWLMDRNIVSGLETAAYESLLVKSFCGGSVGVRRICCDSGSLTSAKRDFIVVTSVSIEDDGTLVVASRSVYVPDRPTTLPRRSKQGHIRGIVHASGFVLRPCRARGGGDGPDECEVLFGTHVDLLSPAAGRTHRSTLAELTASALTILERLEEFFRLSVAEQSSNDGAVPPVVVLRSPAPSPHLLPPACACPNLLLLRAHPDPSATPKNDDNPRGAALQVSLTIEQTVNLQSAGSAAVAHIRHLHESLTGQQAAGLGGSDEARPPSPLMTPAKAGRGDEESLPASALGALGLRITSPASPTAPKSDQKHTLRSSSVDDDLRSYSSGSGSGSGGDGVGRTGSTDSAYASASSAGTAGTTAGALQCHRAWDTFYVHDGVAIADQPGGIYSARCAVAASPADVRNILMRYPDRIDGLLARRTVLNCLDDGTFLQWAAFGPLWPLGSKDFLVVTTEERISDFQDGFVIAFTSVDELCEDVDGIDAAVEAAVAAAAPSSVNGSNGASTAAGYHRSTVRCAGFIGVPDGDGGTLLSVFVDADVCEEVPGWLVRLLAQYELCEMMRRIRAIPLALNCAHSSATDLRKLAGAATFGADQGLGQTALVADAPVAFKYTGDFFVAEGAALAKEALQSLKTYMGIDASAAGVEWPPATAVDGVAVSSAVVTECTLAARVRATLAVAAGRDALVSLLTSDRRLVEYVAFVDAVEPLVRIDGRTAVRRIRCKPVWPTAPRDFVVLTTWAAFGDGSALVCTCSAPNDVFPPEPGYVRGTVVASGYHVQPRTGGGSGSGGGCQVTLVAHAVLGGSPPASMVAMLTSSAPAKTLNAIADVVRRDGAGRAAVSSTPEAPAATKPAPAAAPVASVGGNATAQDVPVTPMPAVKARPVADGEESAFFLRRPRPLPEPIPTPAPAPVPASAQAATTPALALPETSSKLPTAVAATAPLDAVPPPSTADTPDLSRPLVRECAAVAAAAVMLMKVYLGLEPERPGAAPLRLDWQQRAADKTMVAYTTMVAGRWATARPAPTPSNVLSHPGPYHFTAAPGKPSAPSPRSAPTRQPSWRYYWTTPKSDRSTICSTS